MIHAFPFQANRFRRSLHRGQKSLRRRQKLNVRQFGCNPDALETSFWSAAGFERQQVLVAEVRGEFIKIRLEVDGRGGAEIIGLRARFIREFAPASGA